MGSAEQAGGPNERAGIDGQRCAIETSRNNVRHKWGAVGGCLALAAFVLSPRCECLERIFPLHVLLVPDDAGLIELPDVLRAQRRLAVRRALRTLPHAQLVAISCRVVGRDDAPAERIGRNGHEARKPDVPVLIRIRRRYLHHQTSQDLASKPKRAFRGVRHPKKISMLFFCLRPSSFVPGVL